MDKNRVEGKMKDIKGRAERQVGEWTDNSKLQGEGLADQAEGKIQNAWGHGKDKVREISDRAKDDAAEPSRDSGDRYMDKTKRSA